jgi:hypothetical protein
MKKSISERLNMDELKRVQDQERSHTHSIARRQEVSVETSAEEKFLRDMKEAGVDFDIESGERKQNFDFEKRVEEKGEIAPAPVSIVSMQSANLAREHLKSGISLFGSIARNSSNSIMNGVKQIGSKISQTASSTISLAASSSLGRGGSLLVQPQTDDLRSASDRLQQMKLQIQNESTTTISRKTSANANEDSGKVIVMKSPVAPGTNPASIRSGSGNKALKVSKEVGILIAIIFLSLFVWWWN